MRRKHNFPLWALFWIGNASLTGGAWLEHGASVGISVFGVVALFGAIFCMIGAHLK